MSKIFAFVLFLHFTIFLIGLLSKKPLQIALNINKSVLDVAFKVDYTKKRVNNIKLQSPRNKSVTKNFKKNENKQPLNLAKILKELPSNSKIEATSEKKLDTVLNKLKPKNDSNKKLAPKIEKTPEIKKPEVKQAENNKLKNLVESLKAQTVEPEIKQNLEDEELILGREQFDEVKISLQIHEQIQAKWHPPQGLNPPKPSKWLIKIIAGQKFIEKVEGSGILVFDMAAHQTLLNSQIDVPCADMEIEISFTA